MNKWEKKELKRKFGTTLISLYVMCLGGMILVACSIGPTYTNPFIAALGGMVSGMSLLTMAIIFNLLANPRIFDCVKGGMIHEDECNQRVRERRNKWRKNNE